MIGSFLIEIVNFNLYLAFLDKVLLYLYFGLYKRTFYLKLYKSYLELFLFSDCNSLSCDHFKIYSVVVP